MCCYSTAGGSKRAQRPAKRQSSSGGGGAHEGRRLQCSGNLNRQIASSRVARERSPLCCLLLLLCCAAVLRSCAAPRWGVAWTTALISPPRMPCNCSCPRERRRSICQGVHQQRCPLGKFDRRMASPLEAALKRRDFAAAQTIFKSTPGLAKEAAEQWRAWLLFHAGSVEEALEAYAAAAAAAATVGGGSGKSYDLHRAACLFQLRRYREAQEMAERVSRGWVWPSRF